MTAGDTKWWQDEERKGQTEKATEIEIEIGIERETGESERARERERERGNE